MADGRHFISKIKEILDNDIELQSLLNNNKIKVAYFSPVGNKYPQITIWIDEGKSEPMFPAGWYKFFIYIWFDKKDTNQIYSKSRQIIKRVNEILNRKGTQLSEIDIVSNTGLRVVNCLKEGGEIVFDKDSGMYYTELIYEVVISEDEDFNANYNGWV